jgi:hypothetical protein
MSKRFFTPRRKSIRFVILISQIGRSSAAVSSHTASPPAQAPRSLTSRYQAAARVLWSVRRPLYLQLRSMVQQLRTSGYGLTQKCRFPQRRSIRHPALRDGKNPLTAHCGHSFRTHLLAGQFNFAWKPRKLLWGNRFIGKSGLVERSPHASGRLGVLEKGCNVGECPGPVFWHSDSNTGLLKVSARNAGPR